MKTLKAGLLTYLFYLFFLGLSLTGLLFSSSFANSNAKKGTHTHTHTFLPSCSSARLPHVLWLVSPSFHYKRQMELKICVNHAQVYTLIHQITHSWTLPSICKCCLTTPLYSKSTCTNRRSCHILEYEKHLFVFLFLWCLLSGENSLWNS